mmetsp:Transcript_102776/g.201562  ORF Transcript_102776/g.201562 Transcript_102776/m.201562 type:complete len:210 (+) Transcript_102776:223-852(+)
MHKISLLSCFLLSLLKYSLSDPCVASPISNCAECTAQNSTRNESFAWCTNPKFCFAFETQSPCLTLCSGGYNKEGQSAQCDDVSTQSTISAMLLLIGCPFCLVGGCLYLTVQRLRNAALNKVSVEFDGRTPPVQQTRPIPLLQVYTPNTENQQSFIDQEHRLFGTSTDCESGVVYAQATVAQANAYSGEIPFMHSSEKNAILEAHQITS